MKVMQCKLCQQEKKLIRAHIIPEAFFKPLQDGRLAPEMLKQGEYPKRIPIGIYDTTILCEECERIFSPWDDYAQELLLREFEEQEYYYINGKKVAILRADVDYRKLKLFFLSLVWRASVSSHDFFKKLDVRSFEHDLRQHILTNDPGDSDAFAVSLAKFEHPLGTGILDPRKDRWDGINYVRFYLGGYVAYIKMDRRPAPIIPGSFRLVPGQPFLVLLRDLNRSKELPLIRKIIEHSGNLRKG